MHERLLLISVGECLMGGVKITPEQEGHFVNLNIMVRSFP